MAEPMGVSSVLPTLENKSTYVNRMFARIAHRYDLMNQLMTVGQDQRWRQRLLAAADIPPSGLVLDVGTGTGDIACEIQQARAGVRTIGLDFTYEMLAVGQTKMGYVSIPFVQGDALDLPFEDSVFDAVVSGFLLRNVIDRQAALREQARVTKPGGRVVCLETSRAQYGVIHPFFRFYFFQIVPLLGQFISGDSEAYRYLPQSTEDFPDPRALARVLERAGLRNVFYHQLMFGAVAIHVGTRTGQPLK